MAKIRQTNEAVNWLQDIFDYISQDNPNIAHKVIKGIYNKAQILIDFPQIGHLYRKETKGEIRILLYGHYRITYFFLPDNKTVEILGVFHGAMEIDRYLKKYISL